jgi:hypothetical protein
MLQQLLQLLHLLLQLLVMQALMHLPMMLLLLVRLLLVLVWHCCAALRLQGSLALYSIQVLLSCAAAAIL